MNTRLGLNYKKAEAKQWARENLHGHWSSMITPFTPEDEIDLGGLDKNIKKVLKLGTKGIGFTWPGGEFWALTMEERKKVCEQAIRSASGKALVGIHTSRDCLKDCIELSQHAEDAGADLIILSAPYASRTEDQVYRFIERVAEKVNIGVGLLNTPHIVLLGAEAIAKLADIPNVCVIKEASYPVNPTLVLQVQKLAGEKIVVSSPYDEAFFFEEYTGFHQQVMFANPQDWMFDTPEHNYYVQFVNLATSGRTTEAATLFKEKVWVFRKVYDKHWKYLTKKHNGAFPPLFKCWGQLIGMAAGHVRPPILPMTEHEMDLLREDLASLGLIRKAEVSPIGR